MLFKVKPFDLEKRKKLRGSSKHVFMFMVH